MFCSNRNYIWYDLMSLVNKKIGLFYIFKLNDYGILCCKNIFNYICSMWYKIGNMILNNKKILLEIYRN